MLLSFGVLSQNKKVEDSNVPSRKLKEKAVGSVSKNFTALAVDGLWVG